MGQTVMSQILIKNIGAYVETSLRSLNGQYGSNRIVCDTIFFKKSFEHQKIHEF